MKKQLLNIDWQILTCRGKLIDILARINNCLQIKGGLGNLSDYYLQLRREYKSELAILQGLQAEKKKLMPGSEKKDEKTDPFDLQDRKYISTQ